MITAEIAANTEEIGVKPSEHQAIGELVEVAFPEARERFLGDLGVLGGEMC